jgi:hypothetical protein
MPGAAVSKALADDEAGALKGATILAGWSERPDDFVESLQGA